MAPMSWILAWTALCASPGPHCEAARAEPARYEAARYEAARCEAALCAATPPARPPEISVSAGPSGEWRWRSPLTPTPEVLRAFDPPARPWAAGHRGVDLSAEPGQPVYAAGGGRVTFAARLAGRGVIVISHGTLRTTYLPVRASVRPGRRVGPGTRIGTVEHRPGHCGTVPCLHWGALRGPVYVDPLSLPAGISIRLLPVWDVPAPAATGPAPVPAVPVAPCASPPTGTAAHALPRPAPRPAARGLAAPEPPVAAAPQVPLLPLLAAGGRPGRRFRNRARRGGGPAGRSA